MGQGIVLSLIVGLQLSAVIATQIVVIRIFGVGAETDILIAVQAVPLVVGAILAAALQSVWLPRLSSASVLTVVFEKTLSVALGQSAILAGITLLVAIVSCGIWLPLIFPMFDAIQIGLGIHYSVVLLVALFFTVQSLQLTLALRAKSRFYVAETINLVFTVVGLGVTFVVAPLWGIEAVVLVVLARTMLIFLVQMKFNGWPRISVMAGFKDKVSWGKMVPIFGGASLYKMSPLLDRYWASKLPFGGLTTFGLAQTIVSMCATVCEKSICVPITSKFGRNFSAGDYEGIRSAYRKGVISITMFALIYVVLMIVVQKPIVYIFAFVLNIEPDEALDLWWLCLLLVGYFHGVSSGTLPVAVFHAVGDTITPVKVGTIGFLASVVIRSLGFIWFSLPGLVLGLSIYYVLNLMIMSVMCEKKLNEQYS